VQRLTGYRDPPKNQLWQSGHDVTNLAHSKLPPTHFGSKINYAFTIYLSVSNTEILEIFESEIHRKTIDYLLQPSGTLITP
jgi:hypothetical protein